jgi:hypothetical protein
VKVVADTGPLVAAANRRDEAHELAACHLQREAVERENAG